MLMSTLFRAPLMVVGFFASYLVIDAAMKFLGGLFIMAVTGMQVGHVSGLISFVSIGVIASILVVTLIHKVFGLISFLPDYAFSWAGHQSRPMGEGGDEQNVRGAFVASIGRGHSAGSGAVAFKQRQDNLKENQRQNEQLAAGAPRGFDPSDSGSAAPPPSGLPGK